MITIYYKRLFLPCRKNSPFSRFIYRKFKNVEAAGGLVRNEKGECLVIERNGKWDLPKGHREEGEKMETTALREVQEETGAKDLKLGKFICMTRHIYKRNDIYHIKNTYWYEMTCDSSIPLKPQGEEGITKAVWVTCDELARCARNTYLSIVEVLRKDGLVEMYDVLRHGRSE